MCIDNLKQQEGFPFRTYLYICKDCNLEFESRFTEEYECIYCGHNNVHRIYKSPTVIYKGKGFHTTDYGNKKSE